MTEKVIQFPKQAIKREVPEEHLKARQAKADQKMADAIVDDIAGSILTELDNCGVNIEAKTFIKDYILVADSLKAAVYRHFGLEHHLHDFIDQNIAVVEGNLEGMSNDEIKTRIEQVMKELQEAKKDLDGPDGE